MLIISSLLFIFSYFFNVYSDDLYISDVAMHGSLLMALIYGYTNTLYSSIVTRLLLAITTCLLSLYIAIMLCMYVTDQYYLDSIYLFVAMAFSFILLRVTTLKFDKKDGYNEHSTLLAYKRPKNLQGYLASLIWGYGTVALVINGREFKFSKGIFIEREHITNSRYIYKKTKQVPLGRARLMLGIEWKFYRNCFTLIIRKMGNAKTRDTFDCKRCDGER